LRAAERVTRRHSLELSPFGETLSSFLQDVNDEAPAFNAESYDCEVEENAFFGAPVAFSGQAPIVSDADAGANGTFALTLLGENADVFEVREVSRLMAPPLKFPFV